jgi:hypothetical protein
MVSVHRPHDLFVCRHPKLFNGTGRRNGTALDQFAKFLQLFRPQSSPANPEGNPQFQGGRC